MKWASPIAQLVKNLPAMQETLIRFLGQEDSLEKGKATHSSILAQRILYGVAKSWAWLSNFHFHLYFLGCPVHLTPTHINFVKLYIMKIFSREKNIINPQVPIFQLQQWRYLQSLLCKLSKDFPSLCPTHCWLRKRLCQRAHEGQSCCHKNHVQEQADGLWCL